MEGMKDKADVELFYTAYDEFYTSYEAESYGFITTPKLLVKHPAFKGLSIESKWLYGLMLDRASLSRANGWVDQNGRVYIYFTIEDVMEELGCAKVKAIEKRKELVKYNLITIIRKGQGNPDIIIPKKISTICHKWDEEHKTKLQEVQKPNFKNFENQTSISTENKLLNVTKSNPNNTEYNNTEYNNTEYKDNRVQQPTADIEQAELVPSETTSLSDVPEGDNTGTPPETEKVMAKRERDNIDYQKIAALFNENCKSLPEIKVINSSRKRLIKSLIDNLKKDKLYGADATEEIIFTDIFKRVEASDFLTNRSGRWGNCSFDWIIKKANALKVLEGNYDNRDYKKGGTANGSSTTTSSIDTESGEITKSQATSRGALERFRQQQRG